MTTTTVFVFTKNGPTAAWSRYLFPFSVDAFAQLANDLYVRHGDSVSKVSEAATTDTGDEAIDGTVQWNWLDAGAPGVTKMMQGFDLVATGDPSVSIGYDQRNTAAFTTPYNVAPDTLPGGIVPMAVMGPTFSFKVTFNGSPWSLLSAQLSIQPTRGQP